MSTQYWEHAAFLKMHPMLVLNLCNYQQENGADTIFNMTCHAARLVGALTFGHALDNIEFRCMHTACMLQLVQWHFRYMAW